MNSRVFICILNIVQISPMNYLDSKIWIDLDTRLHHFSSHLSITAMLPNPPQRSTKCGSPPWSFGDGLLSISFDYFPAFVADRSSQIGKHLDCSMTFVGNDHFLKILKQTYWAILGGR